MNWIKTLIGMALLAATAPTLMAYEAMLDHDPVPIQIDDPSPDRFSVCFEHSCTQIRHLALTPAQWAKVRNEFSPPSSSAEEERARIAKVIAYLEIEVGQQIGTLDDVGGSFQGFGAKGNQLDCVDESTNSTTYLRMMEADGLLRFHQVSSRASRARSGFFIIGWPHFTAVITENASGEKWAVDSWFRDNGNPPEVVPLTLWKTGWSPEA